MSLLAVVSRTAAGPSVPSLTRSISASASASSTAAGRIFGSKKFRVKPGRHGIKSAPVRDEKGNIIQKKKETRQGAFKPMSASQLSNELFQPEVRETPAEWNQFDPRFLKYENTGKEAAFVMPANDPAKIFGLPKHMLLEFRILSRPSSVVRNVTVKVARMMDRAKETSSFDNRIVFTGRAGCGKSFLLLQTVEYCKANGWIVLYIPRAQNLVNSTTPYTYDIRTQTYLQPTFAFQTLQRMLTVNQKELKALKLEKDVMIGEKGTRGAVTLKEGATLEEVINVAMKDISKALSCPTLDLVMSVLQEQTKFPVLLAIDEFQALYGKSLYRDPHFSTIRPFHLSMPRLILDFASGKRSFKNGAVLGALQASNPMFQIPLELRDALGTGYDHPVSPYDKRSTNIAGYAKGLKVLHVPEQLSVKEATGLFELWMKDRALVAEQYDQQFLAKYTESGGNPRDFVWKGLLGTLET